VSDPSADTAAWVAVAVALFSVVTSLYLYRRGQSDSRAERVKAYDIETLTRLLEMMTGPGSNATWTDLNVTLMESLVFTLSADSRERVQRFQDILINTVPDPHAELVRVAREIRELLQEALDAAVNDHTRRRKS
jgi:hypothetical protein